MSSSTYEMNLHPIAGSVGVEVSFSPSRTGFRDVEFPAELPSVEGIARSIGVGPSLILGWGAPWQGSEALPITVSYWGETPRLPSFHWQLGIDEFVDSPRPSRAQLIYDARKELADTDPEHAYLFELDRNTLPAFLPLCPELTEEQRHEREELHSVLIELLQCRLKERHAGLSISDAVGDRSLRHFNDIFEAAAAHVGQGLDTEGRLLERFAGGLLRHELSIPGFPKPEIISEPDSFFVFLFAEFGLLCMDHNVGVDRWPQLLKSLVKMQSLYLARFEQMPRGDWCLTRFDQPPQQPVAKDVWQAIDADFARISTRSDLERKFFTNLRGASDCY